MAEQNGERGQKHDPGCGSHNDYPCDCWPRISTPAPSSIAEQGAVAWRYDDPEAFGSAVYYDERCHPGEHPYWTETPLYATPPALAEQAAGHVELLRRALAYLPSTLGVTRDIHAALSKEQDT